MIKAIKDFRIYIMHSHVIAFVPNTVVKEIFTQDDPNGKRGKWIANLLEYDIEIRPTKLVKGQGLAKLMTQSNFDCLDMNFIAEISELLEEDKELIPIEEKLILSEWYRYIIFFLHHHIALVELTKSKARFVKLKYLRYYIVDKNLYWKGTGGILLNCFL